MWERGVPDKRLRLDKRKGESDKMLRDQTRERRVGQENERLIGKEESKKRLRDWLVEEIHRILVLGRKRVSQEIERPDEREESQTRE